MNIYQAIMAAADHIERNPAKFRFAKCHVPTDCGTLGCAIGWIDFFLKTSSRVCDGWITSDPLGVSEGEFYARMRELTSDQWVVDAIECSAGLRLYAEKYHGHEKPTERNFAGEMEAMLNGPDLVRESAMSEELSW